MLDFETLVDEIYEAAADPELWPHVLHEVSGFADSAGGIILTRRSDAWLGWRYSSAMAPGAETYMRDGAMRSQATVRLLAANRAGFVDAREMFTEEEWLADPLMTEWAIPAGLHYAAATAIPVPTGDCVVLQINRRVGQPPFERSDIARLDSFRPHLARAGLLAARWRLQRLRAAAEALAMIGLPAAIFDASGKVLAANTLIEEMKSHLVWLPKDRVALIDPDANGVMQRAIAESCNSASTAARSFPARGKAQNLLVAHIIPVTGEARDLFGGGICVLALTAVATPAAPDAALIQGLFDLTAAEARVASGVAEGLAIEQIAARHGVAVATIRTQVKAIFAKTGSNRQSQLAALLASQPRIPLSPPDE